MRYTQRWDLEISKVLKNDVITMFQLLSPHQYDSNHKYYFQWINIRLSTVSLSVDV